MYEALKCVLIPDKVFCYICVLILEQEVYCCTLCVLIPDKVFCYICVLILEQEVCCCTQIYLLLSHRPLAGRVPRVALASQAHWPVFDTAPFRFSVD